VSSGSCTTRFWDLHRVGLRLPGRRQPDVHRSATDHEVHQSQGLSWPWRGLGLGVRTREDGGPVGSHRADYLTGAAFADPLAETMLAPWRATARSTAPPFRHGQRPSGIVHVICTGAGSHRRQ